MLPLTTELRPARDKLIRKQLFIRFISYTWEISTSDLSVNYMYISPLDISININLSLSCSLSLSASVSVCAHACVCAHWTVLEVVYKSLVPFTHPGYKVVIYYVIFQWKDWAFKSLMITVLAATLTYFQLPFHSHWSAGRTFARYPYQTA